MPGRPCASCDLQSHPPAERAIRGRESGGFPRSLDGRSDGLQDRPALPVPHPMIDDPPVLTIRRKFQRAERSLLEAFAATSTGFIVDAMAGQGALDRRIKPLPGTPTRFVGSALPCSNGPA